MSVRNVKAERLYSGGVRLYWEPTDISKTVIVVSALRGYPSLITDGRHVAEVPTITGEVDDLAARPGEWNYYSVFTYNPTVDMTDDIVVEILNRYLVAVQQRKQIYDPYPFLVPPANATKATLASDYYTIVTYVRKYLENQEFLEKWKDRSKGVDVTADTPYTTFITPLSVLKAGVNQALGYDYKSIIRQHSAGEEPIYGPLQSTDPIDLKVLLMISYMLDLLTDYVRLDSVFPSVLTVEAVGHFIAEGYSYSSFAEAKERAEALLVGEKQRKSGVYGTRREITVAADIFMADEDIFFKVEENENLFMLEDGSNLFALEQHPQKPVYSCRLLIGFCVLRNTLSINIKTPAFADFYVKCASPTVAGLSSFFNSNELVSNTEGWSVAARNKRVAGFGYASSGVVVSNQIVPPAISSLSGERTEGFEVTKAAMVIRYQFNAVSAQTLLVESEVKDYDLIAKCVEIPIEDAGAANLLMENLPTMINDPLTNPIEDDPTILAPIVQAILAPVLNEKTTLTSALLKVVDIDNTKETVLPALAKLLNIEISNELSVFQAREQIKKTIKAIGAPGRKETISDIVKVITGYGANFAELASNVLVSNYYYLIPRLVDNSGWFSGYSLVLFETPGFNEEYWQVTLIPAPSGEVEGDFPMWFSVKGSVSGVQVNYGKIGEEYYSDSWGTTGRPGVKFKFIADLSQRGQIEYGQSCVISLFNLNRTACDFADRRMYDIDREDQRLDCSLDLDVISGKYNTFLVQVYINASDYSHVSPSPASIRQLTKILYKVVPIGVTLEIILVQSGDVIFRFVVQNYTNFAEDIIVPMEGIRVYTMVSNMGWLSNSFDTRSFGEVGTSSEEDIPHNVNNNQDFLYV